MSQVGGKLGQNFDFVGEKTNAYSAALKVLGPLLGLTNKEVQDLVANLEKLLSADTVATQALKETEKTLDLLEIKALNSNKAFDSAPDILKTYETELDTIFKSMKVGEEVSESTRERITFLTNTISKLSAQINGVDPIMKNFRDSLQMLDTQANVMGTSFNKEEAILQAMEKALDDLWKKYGEAKSSTDEFTASQALLNIRILEGEMNFQKLTATISNYERDLSILMDLQNFFGGAEDYTGQMVDLARKKVESLVEQLHYLTKGTLEANIAQQELNKSYNDYINAIQNKIDVDHANDVKNREVKTLGDIIGRGTKRDRRSRIGNIIGIRLIRK
jgi:chromosome segregation ATPase